MNIAVKTDDQWSAWRAALAGAKLDLGARGETPSGYYRFKPWKGKSPQEQEVVAIWRDQAEDGSLGDIQCWRSVGYGPTMSALRIDELFTWDHCAIPAEIYQAVTERGEPWPEIYTTWLPTKDIVAGVVWTEAWARKFLSQNPETHDEDGNPRAVIGDNGPPEELTPPEALAKRVKGLDEQLAAFLKSIGGAPKDKAQADTVANYATHFKNLSNEATAAHKVEKAAPLEACRVIDSTWFPVRDSAEAARKKALAIADVWINAERAARQEEARKANEAARAAAVRQAAISGDAPAPVAEVKVEPIKIGTGRSVSQKTRKVAVITDLAAFLAYLAAMAAPPPDLIDLCEKLAGRLLAANVRAPGIESQERSAAS
jgi:hypothetical protein